MSYIERDYVADALLILKQQLINNLLPLSEVDYRTSLVNTDLSTALLTRASLFPTPPIPSNFFSDLNKELDIDWEDANFFVAGDRNTSDPLDAQQKSVTVDLSLSFTFEDDEEDSSEIISSDLPLPLLAEWNNLENRAEMIGRVYSEMLSFMGEENFILAIAHSTQLTELLYSHWSDCYPCVATPDVNDDEAEAEDQSTFDTSLTASWHDDESEIGNTHEDLNDLVLELPLCETAPKSAVDLALSIDVKKDVLFTFNEEPFVHALVAESTVSDNLWSLWLQDQEQVFEEEDDIDAYTRWSCSLDHMTFFEKSFDIEDDGLFYLDFKENESFDRVMLRYASSMQPATGILDRFAKFGLACQSRPESRRSNESELYFALYFPEYAISEPEEISQEKERSIYDSCIDVESLLSPDDEFRTSSNTISEKLCFPTPACSVKPVAKPSVPISKPAVASYSKNSAIQSVASISKSTKQQAIQSSTLPFEINFDIGDFGLSSSEADDRSSSPPSNAFTVNSQLDFLMRMNADPCRKRSMTAQRSAQVPPPAGQSRRRKH